MARVVLAMGMAPIGDGKGLVRRSAQREGGPANKKARAGSAGVARYEIICLGA